MSIVNAQFQDWKGNVYHFETSVDMIKGADEKFAPLEHNHDDRYYTEKEIDKMADDLKKCVVDGKEKIANAINDKTNDNQMNKDNTFDELADGIRGIKSSGDSYDPITFMNFSIIRYLLNSPKDVMKNLYIFESNTIGVDGKCQLFTTWGGTSERPGTPIYDNDRTRLTLGYIKRGQYLVGLKWNTIDNFGDDAVFDIDGAEYEFNGISHNINFGFTPIPINGANDEKYANWDMWITSGLNPALGSKDGNLCNLRNNNINIAHKGQTPKIINNAALFIQQAHSEGKLRFRGQCEGFFYFLIPTKLKA